MKRACTGMLLALLLCPARAAEGGEGAAATSLLAAPPAKMGYAFDQPDILIRQRLFGLAHGVSLLAAACLDLPAYSGTIQDAYAAWHAKQGKTIEAVVRDLAAYYFGARAGEAQWPDLARALNLADRIEPLLSEVTLHAACASLPEAIRRPRYELDRLLVEGMLPEPAPQVASPAPVVQPSHEARANASGPSQAPAAASPGVAETEGGPSADDRGAAKGEAAVSPAPTPATEER